MEQLLHTPFDEQRRKGYGVSKNVAGFGACPCCDESTVLVVAPEGSEKDDPRDYRFANHLLQGSSKPCLASGQLLVQVEAWQEGRPSSMDRIAGTYAEFQNTKRRQIAS